MLLIPLRSLASFVSIGIFDDVAIRSIVLTTQSGNYAILLDSLTKINADTNDVFYLSLVNDSLQLSTLDRNFGKFKRIDFVGSISFQAGKEIPQQLFFLCSKSSIQNYKSPGSRKLCGRGY
jgi:hypothetical protein